MSEARFNILDKTDDSHVSSPSANGNGAHGKTDKIDRYAWKSGGDMGEFRMVPKAYLNIDGRYQRPQVSEGKVRDIARDWNWLLFGTLSVIEREDGTLWVFDGGHRTRAAFKRSDVKNLPCMVHSSTSVRAEARAFKLRNTMLSTVSAFDRYRADLCAEDPVAIQLAEMLEEFGITAMAGGACKSTHISCMGALLKGVESDYTTAKRSLEYLLLISDDRPVSGTVFTGLFTLQSHFQPGLDVIGKFGDKLSSQNMREIEVRISQFKSECGKGGSVIAAKAILSLINKKRRNKLEW